MKSIEESNKLIAEFMGAEILKKGQLAYDLDSKFPNGSDRIIPEKMKYQSSWNWIMPVVQKIKDIPNADTDKIDDVLCCDLSITNLFSEVVDFITKEQN